MSLTSAPIRSLLSFDMRQSLNLYAIHYIQPFAFSYLLYPLDYRFFLRKSLLLFQVNELSTITTYWAYQVPLNLFSFGLRFHLYSEGFIVCVWYVAQHHILALYLLVTVYQCSFTVLPWRSVKQWFNFLTISNFPIYKFYCI